MKLTALYESSAGYGMAYQILGAKPKNTIPDLFRPKGIERWYHRESAMTLRHRETQETEFPCGPAIPSTLAESKDGGPYNRPCPMSGCDSYAIQSCRCFRADSLCENGHKWHYCTPHKTVVIGESDHKKAGCSCAARVV